MPSQPVHSAHWHSLWEASQEHGNAALVGSLGAGAKYAAHHNVAHSLQHIATAQPRWLSGLI